MRFEDSQGVEAFEGRPRPMEFDGASIERTRDLHMLAMRRSRVPLKVIAQYFGLSLATVKRRIAAIPQEARRHYGRRSLG